MTGFPMTVEGRIMPANDYLARFVVVTEEAVNLQKYAQRFATLDEYIAEREAAAGQ